MIEMSEQLRHALEAQTEVRLIDPESRREYIVIRADLFERMRKLLEA
jgi:hypothetical protein